MNGALHFYMELISFSTIPDLCMFAICKWLHDPTGAWNQADKTAPGSPNGFEVLSIVPLFFPCGRFRLESESVSTAQSSQEDVGRGQGLHLDCCVRI